MNDEQIATLSAVETKVEALMTNHLPHLQAQLNTLDNRVWWILGVIVIGFVVQIYLSERKKII